MKFILARAMKLWEEKILPYTILTFMVAIFCSIIFLLYWLDKVRFIY